MAGQEFAETILSVLKQNGQVAAVNHMHAQSCCLAHQITEFMVQLRRAASQIKRTNLTRYQHLRNKFDGLLNHHLLAAGAGIDVTVKTRLIALVTQINLQRSQLAAMQRGKLGGLEQW